jgi:hypothetical protein
MRPKIVDARKIRLLLFHRFFPFFVGIDLFSPNTVFPFFQKARRAATTVATLFA